MSNNDASGEELTLGLNGHTYTKTVDFSKATVTIPTNGLNGIADNHTVGGRLFDLSVNVSDPAENAATEENAIGNIYNLGSKKNYSLIQFVDILKQITGVEFEIVPFPDDKKIIDIGDYYGDYSLFNEDTGWSPKVDLIEGITRTIDFYNHYKKAYWS